jgi:hypothetical protein
MKKLLLLLLITVAATGQNQSYTSSTENFPNPDRGFYRYSSSGLVTSTTNYSLLNASTLSGYRTQNISMIHRTFYLNQFIATPISSSFLANMQADFNTIRSAGLKVIIRFAYSKSESATYLDATKAQILAHIQQVAPVIAANRDVISVYQYGWIGCWGETYYSSQINEFGTSDYENYTVAQWANRREVLDAMIAITPIEIPVQVRYVYHKQKMCPNGNDRVGFYNDAFLDAWGDSGTFFVNSSSAQPSAADSNYLQTHTTNLPMAGETDALNAPRTDCANALFEMNKYNWSLLNKDYLAANITNWNSQGCFSDMEKKLGYRFELINSTIANNTLTVNLQNVGFANIFKPRKAFLILKNTTTNTEYSYEISGDLRTWRKGISIQISKTLDMVLPTGIYQMYLNLPDPNISNPLYSIRLSNTGTWDATKGYNNLNQSITIDSTAPNPILGTTSPVTSTSPVTTTSPTLAVEILFINNSTLVINNLLTPNYSISVYNLNGRVKATSTDLSTIRRGYYIVKLIANGTTYTKNIYKQ